MDDCDICYGAKQDCYAIGWSHREICVGCGCCSNDELKRAIARLNYHRKCLSDDENFDGWFYEDERILAIQKRNVAADIEYDRMKIAEYEKLVRELEAENND